MEFFTEQPHEAAHHDHPIARVMYASEAAIDGSVYSEMERIRAAAVRHNEPVGVHTALLYQSGWFVQWKEGPSADLLRIMDRVAADPRHHSLRIVHSSRGPRLLSGPWSMAIVQCGDSRADMQGRVQQLQRSMEAGVQLSPPAAWRRLSTPMRHPGAARQADPDAFQRIMVCAAEGTASFDLADWLARRHQEEVVHRRFAGAYDLDVGSDYVDFADGDKVMRVIAMARKGLLLPLTRAFLPDYSHLVLLLSEHDDSNLALVQKVAEACCELAAPPAVLAIAGDANAHKRPFALARAHGLVYLDALADPRDPQSCWTAMQPCLRQWREAANSGMPPVALRRVGGFQ